MRKIGKDEIQHYNAEQIAGMVLTILQEINQRKLNVSYYPGSTESILSFELAPIWLGKNVVNGCLVHDWGVSSYGGDSAPLKLQTLFNDAIGILKGEGLIRQDPTQRSSVFIQLTDKGRQMAISDNFELDLERDPRDLISYYSGSVFLIETVKDGDVSCGTCFLIEDGYIITCRHNIDGRKFTVYFDDDTKIEDSLFDVQFHPERDIAVLTFKSKKLEAIVQDTRPFSIDESELIRGDQVITMGFPLVSQRKSQLLVDVGTFQSYTTAYLDDAKYLTFSNKIDGGCSGGPVISLRGKVVGIITESTEQSADSIGEKGVARGTSIYGHGTPISHVNDIL